MFVSLEAEKKSAEGEMGKEKKREKKEDVEKTKGGRPLIENLIGKARFLFASELEEKKRSTQGANG